MIFVVPPPMSCVSEVGDERSILKRSRFLILTLSLIFWPGPAARGLEPERVALPQTGQTRCYDKAGLVVPCRGTGQDGEQRAGVSWPLKRFFDTGAGALVDRLTGLMWPQEANAPGSEDCVTGARKTWGEALDHVACLNDSRYLGYKDWRLPTVNELASLLNAGDPEPARWLAAQGFRAVEPAHYWSSTPLSYVFGEAWAVSFAPFVPAEELNGGILGAGSITDARYVWPVREAGPAPAPVWQTGPTAILDERAVPVGGVVWPSPRFVAQTDGTVSDRLTGLVWLQDTNCLANHYPAFDRDGEAGDGFVSWQSALDFAAGVNAGRHPRCGAGRSDWRLPNQQELHSLTDFSGYNPPLPPGHPFLNLLPAQYWSSTTLGGRPDEALIVNMWSGYMGHRPKSAENGVWLVRGGTGNGRHLRPPQVSRPIPRKTSN